MASTTPQDFQAKKNNSRGDTHKADCKDRSSEYSKKPQQGLQEWTWEC